MVSDEHDRRRRAALHTLNPQAFDERGILRPGQRVIVPLTFMDSAGLADEQVARLRGGAFYKAVQSAVSTFTAAHKHAEMNGGPGKLLKPSDAAITAAINRVREHYGDGEAVTLEVVLGLAEEWPAQAAWLAAIEATLAANGKTTSKATGDTTVTDIEMDRRHRQAVANDASAVDAAREAMIRDMTSNGSYLPARAVDAEYCMSDAGRIESETRAALARSEMIADLQKAGRT